MVICLERDADLHIAQLMPLPLTVSCFSKIQIGFTFLVPAHPCSPKKGPLNGCVCVCDAWPVQSQTYGYLRSHRASPPLDKYQIILMVTEAHVCEQLAQGCSGKAQGRQPNPRPSESQVQRANHYVTRLH